MSMRHPLALAALAISAAACASASSFRSTWKNPDAAPVSLAGKKVLAVVQVRDEARRRSGEDLLAAEITKRGGQGVASYTIFPSSGRDQDEAAAEARAKERGFSGLVIMRFLGREKTVTREPDPDAYWRNDQFFRRPWGAWVRGWNSLDDPVTVRTDIAVIVETRVYSLEQQKLLWTGTSATVNPENAGGVVKDLSSAVAHQLEQSGVLAKQ